MSELVECTSPLGEIEQLHFATRFLALESKLLDERRFDEWAEMLDEDLTYEIPLREGGMDYAAEFTEGAFRTWDNRASIVRRIARLKSGYAWAETPASRTVRVVGSILVEPGVEDRTLRVDSAVIVYRQRNLTAEPGDIIPVRRSDVLRITPDGGRLVSRRASIPDTSLQTPNLGIFL